MTRFPMFPLPVSPLLLLLFSRSFFSLLFFFGALSVTGVCASALDVSVIVCSFLCVVHAIHQLTASLFVPALQSKIMKCAANDDILTMRGEVPHIVALCALF